MAKSFAPRVSKRERKVIALSENYQDLFRFSDQKLLEGAKLDEVILSEIQVKEQVRTKFNDASLKELSENIKANGLIQPLVLHRKNGKLTLICGERRFRAMGLIKMEKAPCFILENKNEEELMAIQFSENSSREALHYIDKADGILNYQKATKASERKIQTALGISKSEVHRSLIIAKLPKKMKDAAKLYNIEKYVLIEFSVLEKSQGKKKIEEMILAGEILKRIHFKKALNGKEISKSSLKNLKVKGAKTKSLQHSSASAFLKAMKVVSKDMKLDKETEKVFKNLINQTQNVLD